MRDAIDIEKALSAIVVLIHQDLVTHRVRDVLAVTALECVSHSGESRVEVRMRYAAPFAWSAIMARRPSIDGTGEIGGACGRHHPAQLVLYGTAKFRLLAVEAHIRLKLAVRQLFETFRTPSHPNVF